jgi:hypothetical protein
LMKFRGFGGEGNFPAAHFSQSGPEHGRRSPVGGTVSPVVSIDPFQDPS